MTLLTSMLDGSLSNGVHEPKHILDLLKKAATTTDKGLSYLDNGISEAPITVSYAQLYAEAKVGGSVSLGNSFLQARRKTQPSWFMQAWYRRDPWRSLTSTHIKRMSYGSGQS